MIARTLAALAALTAVAGCSSDTAGGDAGFAAMLEQVPAEALDGTPTVQYVDMDLVWQRLGLADATAEERGEYLGELAAQETFTLPLALFGNLGGQIEDARAEVGFDMFQIRRELAVDQLPSVLRIAEVAVSGDEIEAAVAADPTWSDRLATVENDAGTFFDWTGDAEELEHDMRRITPMRPLGIGGQLAVAANGDEATIVRTHERRAMAEVLATAAGKQTSAADDEPFDAVLAALGDADVIQAFAVLEPITVDNALRDLTVERIDELLAEYPPLEPYDAIVVVEIADGDDVRTETLIVYDDEEDAAADVETVQTLVADGLTVHTDEPVADIFPDAEVSADGPVLRITVAGPGNFYRPVNAIVERDVLLTD